jgi:Acetyltransferases, including N-acetylases of ribosomal proteins
VKLILKPLTPEDLEIIIPRAFEAREMAMIGNLPARVAACWEHGAAYCGWLGGDILACAGVTLLWRGVGAAWCITSPLVARHPLSFHRAVRRMLDLLEASLGLHRVQVEVQGDHFVSQRWVERLGFEFEGFMPGYGPDGSRYVRFGRVRQPREGA